MEFILWDYVPDSLLPFVTFVEVLMSPGCSMQRYHSAKSVNLTSAQEDLTSQWLMRISIRICSSNLKKVVEPGHKAALVKEQCRLDMRKYSFSQRVINEWNKLSNDCFNASSVNMFENRIDMVRLYIDDKIVELSIGQWLPCPLATWNV